jgi:hypothetical protein
MIKKPEDNIPCIKSVMWDSFLILFKKFVVVACAASMT